jgi:hypothetical protein
MKGPKTSLVVSSFFFSTRPERTFGKPALGFVDRLSLIHGPGNRFMTSDLSFDWDNDFLCFTVAVLESRQNPPLGSICHDYMNLFVEHMESTTPYRWKWMVITPL